MTSRNFKIIEGGLKVTLLYLVGLSIIVYIFFKSGGKSLLLKWQQHRDNPAVIPIAGILGKDSVKNTQGVIYSSFKTNFSFLMKPLQYIIKLIRDILGKLVNSMNLFRAIMKPIRDFFTQAAKSFYDKLNNFSITIVYFFSKMRNLLRRLSSTFRLTLYTLQAVHLTLKSVWYGPVGQVSRDWAYSFDIIHKFFCLHPNTKVKLANCQFVAVKDLKIGDKIYLPGGGHQKIKGIAISKANNKTEFVEISNNVLTGNHLVKHNKDWVRAKKIGIKSIKNSDYIYCPICDSCQLVLENDLIVRDFSEIDDSSLETIILNYTIHCLNNNENKEMDKLIYKKVQLIGEPGISENSLVNLPNGKFIMAKDIEIGCQLENGKVLAIVKFQLDKNISYQINDKLNITSRQILYTNKHWGLFQNDDKISHNSSNSIYYNFLTTNGSFRSGDIILADIRDGLTLNQLDNIDDFIEETIQ